MSPPLETIKLDSENLFHLLDFMLSNSEGLHGIQLERLLGLALNLSDGVQQWLEQEYQHREQQH